MSSPENLSSDEVELTMLRSDLNDLFHAHADKVFFLQSDDLERPTEIILAGRYKRGDGGLVDVQVRQRLDDRGTDYIFIAGTPGDYNWCQITDNFANRILAGEYPLDDDDISAVRRFIAPGVTDWSLDASQEWAVTEKMYDLADSYARRH